MRLSFLPSKSTKTAVAVSKQLYLGDNYLLGAEHSTHSACLWNDEDGVYACRVSLGYMSTFEDVEAFSLFLERTYTDLAADVC
jgi:selenocysteine lyase/cysteine desulfurase